jgi:hypothetical protein
VVKDGRFKPFWASQRLKGRELFHLRRIVGSVRETRSKEAFAEKHVSAMSAVGSG